MIWNAPAAIPGRPLRPAKALVSTCAWALGLFAAALLIPAASLAAEPGYRVMTSSYLEGTSSEPGEDHEYVRDVAFDREGNLYLVGGTQSEDFPVTEGAYDTSFDAGWFTHARFGEMDVFVTKLSPEGKLLWSTYLGGPEYDRAYAVRVDQDGYVYVAGRAGPGYPTTEGAAQPEFAGDSDVQSYGEQDGFVSKLSPDGKTLVWSTYFGDSGGGFIRGIDIDAQGQVYIGATNVGGRLAHITPNAFQPERRGRVDAAFAKLSADGSKVLYATYLGGSGSSSEDALNPSVVAGPDGSAYLLVVTDNEDYPVTPGAFQTRHRGELDAAVTKIGADGSLVFSTFLGGSGREDLETHGLALDRDGNPIIAAGTGSCDFPMPPGGGPRPFSAQRSGPYDSYLAKLSADGTKLLAATYLGGDDGEMIEGIVVTPEGDILVSGTTSSRDFPVTADAIQSELRGRRDFYITKISGDLSRVLYATFYGGSADDLGRSIAISRDGEIAVGGFTNSPDFPTANPIDGRQDSDEAGAFLWLRPAKE